jgi:hypothetical protein
MLALLLSQAGSVRAGSKFTVDTILTAGEWTGIIHNG